MLPKYKVQILNSSLEPLTEIKSFYPLDSTGNFLEYLDKLSAWGRCRFRIATHDSALVDYGNIFEPFKYHVRIYRANVLVWSGVIVTNPRRTRRFVEIEARTYLYLFTKVLVKRDASVAAGDGKDNYRTLSSGSMSTAVTNIINESKADAITGSIMSQITIGTIENPDFPMNYTKADGSALIGSWSFSDDMTLQFDYRDIFYVLSSLAMYPACDFEVTKDLVFNFKQFIGNKQTDILFEYAEHGSITDYNAPLNGDRMANDLTGVAADFGNQILHSQKADDASVQEYGRIQGVAAYVDVKNTNALRSRLTEELRLTSKPDSELHVTLNDKAYPLGQYGLGDVVRIKVKDRIIDVDQLRRIVGIDVYVDGTSQETVRLITNKPKEGI